MHRFDLKRQDRLLYTSFQLIQKHRFGLVLQQACLQIKQRTFSLYLNITGKGKVVFCVHIKWQKRCQIHFHRITQVGWPSAQSRLFRALTSYVFEYLWWWKYHNLQGKAVPVVNHPHKKKFSSLNQVRISYVPACVPCSSSYYCTPLRRVWLCLPYTHYQLDRCRQQ